MSGPWQHAAVPGHLFITRGSLLDLACDAILIPSGRGPHGNGELTSAWSGLDVPKIHGNYLRDAPSKEMRVREVLASTEKAPAIYAAHSGDDETDLGWYVAPYARFIEVAGPGDAGGKRDRLLLGVPLLGTGAGGKAHEKGAVVQATVRTILSTLERSDLAVDVVLVLKDPADYSAAQAARRRESVSWEGTEECATTVEALAKDAVDERLVLFIGAGVSMGAGLPSWGELLDKLAAQVPDLDDTERGQLGDLDPRDAGMVIAQRLKSEDLRAAIKRAVHSDRVSLQHQLLASLPVAEVLTTNYDDLFERAWRSGGRPLSVLPEEGRVRTKEWLAKLHGSVNDDDRPLVLSRPDYLRLEGASALGGIVQAALLTRHLLFVGYSLKDDNFHRIVHQVRETIATSGDDGRLQRFGTVLTADPPGLFQRMWRDLEFVSTADATTAKAFRQLAIFLDRLAARTAPVTEHLMNPSYDALFTDDEKQLRAKLADLREFSRTRDIGEEFGDALADALHRFGY